ncbi:MAG: hypothetical protein M3Z56_01890, partial [Bacteroidota bacterium]|nr:hypothetical protein [Bacteroidota bacterium]
MPAKIQQFFRRKAVKPALIAISVLIIAVAGVHIWFVSNAKRLLIELVAGRSGGKLTLELSHMNFNIFSDEIKIHKAIITSKKNANEPITYQVHFSKVVLHTNSVWSLLTNRPVEIRQIKFYDPNIEVFSWQKDSSNLKNNLSLGSELGKLYNSVQDAITTLHTQSVSILNARLTLINKRDTTKRPVIFSNIYFTLKNMNKQEEIPGQPLDKKNIIFSSTNQDISLTDGMHKLLFKKLRVLQGRSIILDSCTIIALPSKTSNNNYRILFKKLALIGVNFDTLYKTNLIKADSVYCENPVSTINLNPADPDSSIALKGIPDLEKILKEFSGNLEFGFVGVKNADIHVNISRKQKHVFINSAKGNFQIKDLRINPDSSQPISIKNFEMIIKGYTLYNADSSCIYSFDSVRFANDKLLLNNFSIHTAPGLDKMRNYRDYTMPYFELLGMDWPELIFKQNLKATQGILHEPVINLRKVAKTGISKKSLIFNSRHTFDDFMEIDRLRIENGRINIKWGSGNYLQLQGFDLSLLANNVVDYKHVRQKDVESLFFPAGYLKIGDIMASLQNVQFKANDDIHAGQLFFNSALRGIDAKIEDVSIKNIYNDESNGSIIMDGLEWERGTVLLNTLQPEKEGNNNVPLLLKNISGKQTQIKLLNVNGGNESHAFVEEINISSLIKNGTSPLQINGLKLKGKEMDISHASLRMNAENFILSDNEQQFSKFHFEHINDAGTLLIDAPSVHFNGNINSFFTNDLHLNLAVIKSPAVNYSTQNAPVKENAGITKFPGISIDQVIMEEPAINLQLDKSAASLSLNIPFSKGNKFKANNIQTTTNGLRIGNLDFSAKTALVKNGIKKALKIDDGVDVI